MATKLLQDIARMSSFTLP